MLDKIKTPFNILLIAGSIIEIFFLGFVLLQGEEKTMLNYIIVYFVVTIIVFSLWLFLRNRKEKTGGNELFLIILFALIFRITLIPSGLSTSGDVYRYLWDGKVTAGGYNPFEYAPDDPGLIELHSDKLPQVLKYKNTTAIYPAASQYMFAFVYLVFGESVYGFKVVYLFADLIIIALIVLLLRHKKLDEKPVILYAWLPMPVMEYFVNVHLDIVGVMFFLLFIYLFLKEKYSFASIAFALSVLTKIYPVMFIPFIFRKLGWKKSVYFSAVSIVIAVLFYIPFIPKQSGLLDPLLKYISNWCFNGSIFKIFYEVLQNNQQARLISYSFLAVTIIYIFLRKEDFLKSIYLCWIAFIVFTPTLYPWYLGWIAAVNPLFAYASVNSLLLTVDVSNFTPLSNNWTEYWWALAVQYIPFYSLLIYDILKHRKTNAYKQA